MPPRALPHARIPQRYRVDALESQYGRASAASAAGLEVSPLDVVDEAQCAELAARPALKGVWHVAMVLKDTLFKNMTAEKWAAVNDVKVAGIENLDKATRGMALDAFVAFSSVSSLFGNVGQANYSYANAACETVVARRNAAGHAGCAVQWGMIDNVGFFSGNDAKVLETFLAFQNIDASLHSLHRLVLAGGVTTSYRMAAQGAAAGGGAEEAFELSLQRVKAKFAEILGGKADDYDATAPLSEYGLDSLSSIEVVNWMNRHTTRTVNPSFMTPDMTIGKMFDFMVAHSK